MRRPQNTLLTARSLLLLAAFVLLAGAIIAEPSRRLRDFDQSFYTTIAYDIERHGVFSSGIFDGTDSTRDVPTPGMFFVPGYPLLVLAAMKMDSRFGEAVRCSVEANHGLRDEATCEDYALPMHLAHAFLLAIAVFAFARAAELIFGSARVFWLAGFLATASFAAHAALLSFVMTESTAVALYSVLMLFALLAWQTSRLRYFIVSGVLLGLLCLTRPSFVVLCPILLVISLLNGIWLTPKPARQVLGATLAFLVAFVAVVGPWIVRNQLSVGKVGLTEEYAAAVLIERFAYNHMTPGEFIGLFPYCVPVVGDIAFDKESVTGPMHRFLYYAPDSIFHLGRNHRDALLEQYVHLDPVISRIAMDEMRTNWWRHLLVSIPLGWCGMWVGRWWALITLPLFAAASVRAARKQRPYLLLYAAPALVMLGLHGLLANESTRYNLALIGPFCAGAAWLMISMVESVRSRWRAPSPAL
jgi:4-amino-4-deoxy-L-arabinose transferase-like glycosyltransferase